MNLLHHWDRGQDFFFANAFAKHRYIDFLNMNQSAIKDYSNYFGVKLFEL